MNVKLSNVLTAATVALLLAASRSQAQSAYFNAITNLNPVGYWPMHEVAAAAPGDIETNYGTLGPLGNGFYPDWANPANGSRIKRGVPGALANDADTAVNFTLAASSSAGTFTNVLFVPRISASTALNPPFTVECWVYPTNQANQSVWSSSGYEGLNSGGFGSGAGAVGGITLQWNGTNTGFQVYNYYNSSALLTEGHSGNTNSPNNTPLNQWYHVVLTCDANTNINLYINANQGLYDANNNGPFTDVPAVGLYTPDFWSPIQIGGGRGGTRNFGGYVDEFAIYTNVITDIGTHYNDGISGGPGTYFHDITNDQPVVYLRMDAPATYTPPAAATWPALINYGSAGANGAYTPGTTPGALSNDILNPNGVPFAGLPGNVTALSGVSSFADAGYAAAYNPVGPTPFSVTALFRGNPCDGRFNSIVGHSDDSWNLMVNNTGHVFWRFGTNSAANPVSIGIYNNGEWHQVVAVYSPNSDPNLPGTNSLYIDGLLEYSTNNATTNGFGPGTNLDVIIGGDPQFTNNPAGVGRQFAGQICDVAIFTNSLTAPQVQSLYSALDVAPYIISQPATGQQVNGGIGTQATLDVSASGSSPLAYQWYFNASSNYSAATRLVDGSTYRGATNSQLTVTNLTSAASGYYFAVITNNFGSVTSSLASLTVFAAPAFSAEFPVTYTNAFTLFAGASPMFSVSVNGAQPISYYWFTNNVLDTSATDSNFTWSNVSIGSLSTYCVASNVAGVVTGEVWTASVITAPTAPYPASVLALNPSGYWRLNEGSDNGVGNDGVVALDYAGGNDAIYTNVYLGNAGYSAATDPNETSALFGEFGSLPASDNDAGQIQGIDFSTPGGSNGEFTVEAWANGVNVKSFPQIFGAPLFTKGIYGVDDQFNLGIDSSKTHYRFYVRDASGTVFTVGSGTSPALDNSWHHIVGVCDEANGQLSLFYDGKLVGTAAIPTNSGIYATPEPASIGAGTSDGVSYANQFIGNINDLAVYNHALTLSEVQSQYSSAVSGGIPVYLIQSPPISVTLNAGDSLTLPATAAGTAPLGYYWTDASTGTNVLAGATNGAPLDATLTVGNIPASWNHDQLELTLTNAYGTNTWIVSLNVLGAPVIVNDLPRQISLLRGSYLYSIGVSGVQPYTYQWYNSSTEISGQTNATFTATVGASGSSTTYYVVVTNVYGAVTSSVSTFATASLPTNVYAADILRFNPTGYWPMHEMGAAARGDIETNYGTLGALGTGYYPDWANSNGNVVARGFAGALTNDPDTAVYFTGGGVGANTTNAMYVPHTSPLATLNPPFTVECWFYPANSGGNQEIWSQSGFEGLNAGNTGAGQGSIAGIRLNWGVSPNQFRVYTYDGSSTAHGLGITPGVVGQWNHIVITCDANTNFDYYVNGSLKVGPKAAVGLYTPDYWSPFEIGIGRGNLNPVTGGVDEVAIYTNVLQAADISTHYNDGIAGSAGTYVADVLSDNPVIYLRMDSSAYTAPAGDLPSLANYGSAAVNGFYSPGVVPGGTAGPTNAAGFVTTNAMPGNGVSSFADAGYDSSFDPTGVGQSLSITAWFKGNPADGRIQTIMGHSDASWRMAMTAAGTLQFAVAGDTILNSIGVYNDGNWHQFVGVYDGVGGNEYLYVDGALDSSAALTPGYSIPGTNLDILIGSDPQYTNNPPGIGRQFAGDICEAAFFNTALTALQVQQLYTATASSVNTTPTNILFSASGGQLTLSWPADHIGWTLQTQTNSPASPGISSNWFDVTGSAETDQMHVPLNPTNGSVFYRLIYRQ